MTDFGLRGLGPTRAGARVAEPIPPEIPAPLRPNPISEPAPQSAPSERVFAADLPDAQDVLGLGVPLDLLAELAIHPRTETPLAIGLFGRPGTGKSLALRKLVQSIETRSKAAASGAPLSALAKVLVARIDAGDLGGPPAIAFAGALHKCLSSTLPAVAAEASQAAEDPRRAAREATERLDAARQKLAAERLALDDAGARRAKLTETVLYETAGTQIDAFARANRTRIRNRLAGLGITGDSTLGYNDLVFQALDGLGGQTAFVLRALWAFKGQAKLIGLALLLFLVALGFGWALTEQETWLGWLRGKEATLPLATWLEAHMDWVATLRKIAFAGAALALAANLFRAFQVIELVFRGRALLAADLASRRRDADAHFEHQARRVETLAGEVEDLARRTALAQRRAGGPATAPGASAEASPFGDDADKERALRFIASVSALIQARERAQNKGASGHGEPPERIVIALDGLDSITAERSRDLLTQAQRLFGPGFVVLIAADPTRLAAGERTVSLEKWIQVPFQVGALAARGDAVALVRAVLDPSAAEPAQIEAQAVSRSLLDEPLSDAETRLLTDLATLAGRSPRATKRFVNLYRLARTLCPEQRGMLALMLAVGTGGTEAEAHAVSEALSEDKISFQIDRDHGGPRLTRALAAVDRLDRAVGITAAREAAATARMFSFDA